MNQSYPSRASVGASSSAATLAAAVESYLMFQSSASVAQYPFANTSAYTMHLNISYLNVS